MAARYLLSRGIALLAAFLFADILGDPVVAADSAADLLGPLSSWKVENYQGAVANGSMENGVYQVTVTKGGNERWWVQLYQTPELPAGKTYEMTFTVKANAARKIVFSVQRDVAPFELVLPLTELAATTDWKTFKVRFKVKETYPGHTRVAIQCGDQEGKVELRSASLVVAK